MENSNELPKKLYIIRDTTINDIEVVTRHKSSKDAFLNKRDPSRYEWVKITDAEHIKRTLRLYDDKECLCFGDIALSYDEYEYFRELFMTVTNGLIIDLSRIMPLVKVMKLDESELICISDALSIIFSRLDSLDNPHSYGIEEDEVVDEFDIWDELSMVIKYFQDDCL